MAEQQPIIAREGWTIIGIAVVVALLCSYFWGPTSVVSVIAWIFVVFCLQFFRDPVRPLPEDPTQLVSPADGKVIVIGPVEADPFRNEPALKLSIFMNVFNVHSNRAPWGGTIQKIWYREGSFLNAALQKASEENECNAIWIKDDEGRDIVFAQIAGLVARRIICHVKEGDTLTRGQRYGFIRFGSRIDMYLPLDTDLTVGLGDIVYSGKTPLGRFSTESE